ncbi:hypothetical protein HNP55_001425 [Paucibacter oligotrophus]|uniref:Tail protein P2 I n=1 Tax=Roseateles oligotrophus TaxID=1769250 RepID=A0A840L3X7_9BURK|nr:hypothetical protein [Roseateles oligotrophus]MBB4842910.1 hypothetical protein [Roseateles oligotrophus]
MNPSPTAERLYQLLPAVHRIRDAQQGGPLQALIAVLAREIEVLEEDLDQLLDDQFIETCADWVAPYIGDLIGYRPLHGVVPKVASPRAEVAHTIAFRRRKGTALMLEELAQDVSGWPAHAVEFFEQLATSQHMRHPRLHAPASADLRNTQALLRLDSAFNATTHLAEMRRPEAGSGRYNIPNIGIFLWRLLALRLTALPLQPDPLDANGRRWRVNPLGADIQLWRDAEPETDISQLARPANVPEALNIRLLSKELAQDYGPGLSLLLMRPPATPVSINEIRICDLRDMLDAGGNVVGWNHEADVFPGQIGLDPQRGRVLLGASADGPLLATFHYGQPSLIGGGEYPRLPSGADLSEQRSVSQGLAWQPQLDALRQGGRLKVQDSLRYAQTPTIQIDAVLTAGASGHQVVISADAGCRPLLAASGDMTLALGARAQLVLEGLVISGGALVLPLGADDEPRELILRDCTLVPGLTLNPDGTPAQAGQPSLRILHPFAKLRLERCICGPLQVVAGATVEAHDCIIDACAPHNTAFDGDGSGSAGAELTLQECTVIGKVHAQILRLVSNSILYARLGSAPLETWSHPVLAQRRQEGCVRFSYIPPGAITPRRHHCQPSAEQPNALPQFTSLRYGQPAYGQLRRASGKALLEGADDGSEMGVLHSLYQPQRESNLRLRLDEYLRFGLHAGLFYAS